MTGTACSSSRPAVCKKAPPRGSPTRPALDHRLMHWDARSQQQVERGARASFGNGRVEAIAVRFPVPSRSSLSLPALPQSPCRADIQPFPCIGSALQHPLPSVVSQEVALIDLALPFLQVQRQRNLVTERTWPQSLARLRVRVARNCDLLLSKSGQGHGNRAVVARLHLGKGKHRAVLELVRASFAGFEVIRGKLSRLCLASHGILSA